MKQKLVYEPGYRYGPYNLLLVKRSDRVNSYGKHKYGWYECLDCSKLFEATNYNVKIGQAIRCSECRKKWRKETSDIGNLNKKYYPGTKLGPNNILFIKEQPKLKNNNQRRGLFKCPVCGKEDWETQLSDICSGKASKCNECSNIWKNKNPSKGEQKIINILNDLDLNYLTEYTFKNCVNPKTNNVLFFDFYLPDCNICIEYDGEQHYKKTRWSHDDFEERKYRDSIKNQYCLNNDIPLIRIPYWDYDKLDKNYLLQLIES